MPTRAGVTTVVVAILGLVAGRVFGIFELYIVAAAMLALVLCASLWVIANWRSLEVSRAVNPPRLHAGDSTIVTLNLSNRRVVPTPVARITDEVEGATRADAHVPPIRRHASTRASYRVPTERRGLVAIGPMKTRVTDPFGLAASTRTSAPDASLLVLPKIDKIVPPPQPGGDIAQQLDRSPNRVGSHGDDFSSLRAYAVGDDLRKVHWPSSARMGDLVVRNENIPEYGHSLIVLDVRDYVSNHDMFELMVSAAASIVVACHDRGDLLRLVTTDGIDLSADNPSGCAEILDYLAVVEQSTSPSITLPPRLNEGQGRVGVLIVAADADPLITSMQTRSNSSGGTFVVRFLSEGASPNPQTSRLTSKAMVEIPHGGEFAPAWTRQFGRSAARST